MAGMAAEDRHALAQGICRVLAILPPADAGATLRALAEPTLVRLRALREASAAPVLGALRETTAPDVRREGGTADAAAVELSVLSVLVRALRCVLVQIVGGVWRARPATHTVLFVKVRRQRERAACHARAGASPVSPGSHFDRGAGAFRVKRPRAARAIRSPLLT